MKYYILDHCETAEDAENIRYGDPKYFAHDSQTAALAAADHFNFGGGWESSWPLKIALIDEEGYETTWDVGVEHEPSFNAVRAE